MATKTKKAPAPAPSTQSDAPPFPLQDLGRPAGVKGIKGLVWVRASDLKKNPKNWRKHPKRQLDALDASIKENGWAGACLYNERTGQMIDGHARQERRNGDIVPVLYGDWTPQEEVRILATLDPIASMAEADTAALRELTESITKQTEAMEAETAKAFESMTNDLNYLSDQLDKQVWEPALLPQAPPPKPFDASFQPGEATKFDTLVPEDEGDPDANSSSREIVVFPSSNDLGIPDLRPDMLSDLVPTDVWAQGAPIRDVSKTFFIFGSNKVGGPSPQPEFKGGVCCFFTNDERFERVWNAPMENAKRLVEQGWGAACTPDFSTWWNFPLAMKIMAIYKARWCGRLWQEHGVRIIPGIVTGGNPDRAAMEIAGIPKNAPVVTLECRAGFDGKDRDTKRKIWLACVNKQLDMIRPGAVVVYGGRGHADWLEGNLYDGPEYVLTDQWAVVRQRVSDTFKREAETAIAAQKGKKAVHV